MKEQCGEETRRFQADGFDWRSEFDCEECRRWSGKPPVPIREATALLRESGLRDFELVHACCFREAAHGAVLHIPTTVLRVDGSETQWIPEVTQEDCHSTNEG